MRDTLQVPPPDTANPLPVCHRSCAGDAPGLCLLDLGMVYLGILLHRLQALLAWSRSRLAVADDQRCQAHTLGPGHGPSETSPDASGSPDPYGPA